MVPTAVRSTKSPGVGDKAREVSSSLRCLRNAFAISMGKVFAKECIWRMMLSSTTNGGRWS